MKDYKIKTLHLYKFFLHFMKNIIIISLFILLPFISIGQKNKQWQKIKIIENDTICNKNPWILVFEDNFDSDSLDLSKWELQAWGQGALNGKENQEYNTLDNIIMSDGNLKIVAKKQTVEQKAVSWLSEDKILEDGEKNLRMYYYTSSNIWTKQEFLYGKLEARIKIPKGKGFWPAFWMYAANPWNEIDVFEFWNEKKDKDLSKILHMTTHYEYEGKTRRHHTTYKGVNFSEDFHIFTMIWEKNKIEWYIDGVLKRTDYKYKKSGKNVECNIDAKKKYKENIIYPQKAMNIILNFAIQSRENAPDNTTSFPAYMEIDYVKFYQKQ